ncbi:MAG: DUF2512 family protein, partial [Desulfocucumaceae bacterium]
AFAVLERNSWGWIATLAIAATALNYLLGDLMVLPRYGNIMASVGDGILGALTAYVIDLIASGFRTTFATLALFAILIAIGEYFFHKYLRRTDEVAP